MQRMMHSLPSIASRNLRFFSYCSLSLPSSDFLYRYSLRMRALRRCMPASEITHGKDKRLTSEISGASGSTNSTRNTRSQTLHNRASRSHTSVDGYARLLGFTSALRSHRTERSRERTVSGKPFSKCCVCTARAVSRVQLVHQMSQQ